MTKWFHLLNCNKPAGRSSRWVVDQVQRLVRPAKVGHAGTLDPLATGVLVVCIGSATRLIPYVQQMRKRYRATFELGRTSTTEDIEGTITELVNSPRPTRQEIEKAAGRFVGEILQRPPAVSAVKVSGQRAYKLARAGKQFELTARPVQIYWLEVVEYEYPRLVLEVECGSGTYIRSLGRDVAESLGTGAMMSALERTTIGLFQISDAVDVDSLTKDNLAAHLQSPLHAVQHLRKLTLDDAETTRIARGQFIACDERIPGATEGEEFAALNGYGDLTAIVKLRPGGTLGAVCNFAAT